MTPVKCLAIMATKGGSGKSTLAVHLSVLAEAEGERVVLLDLDPQESAAGWGDARQKTTPYVIAGAPSGVREWLARAEGDGLTLAVIDTAPHATVGAAQAIEQADLVLIPVRPSPLDVKAAPAAVDLVRAAGRAAAFVITQARARAPEIAQTHEALAEHGFPIAPVVIGERAAYVRAITGGEAVTEFEPAGQAADEIRALWAYVKERLNGKTAEHQSV